MSEKYNDHALDGEKHAVDVQLGEFIDPAREKKLLAKLDLALVPIIMLTYLACFLDRSNIGNVSLWRIGTTSSIADSE
jgi:hypothetical protein